MLGSQHMPSSCGAYRPIAEIPTFRGGITHLTIMLKKNCSSFCWLIGLILIGLINSEVLIIKCKLLTVTVIGITKQFIELLKLSSILSWLLI